MMMILKYVTLIVVIYVRSTKIAVAAKVDNCLSGLLHFHEKSILQRGYNIDERQISI